MYIGYLESTFYDKKVYEINAVPTFHCCVVYLVNIIRCAECCVSQVLVIVRNCPARHRVDIGKWGDNSHKTAKIETNLKSGIF